MERNDRMMTRGRRSALVALLVSAALFVACGGGNNNSSSAAGQKSSTSTTQSGGASGGGNGGSSQGSGTKTIAGQQVNFHASANVSGKSSVEIKAEDFFFTPTVVTGKAGQTIELEVKNEGTTTHNFSLPSSHISKNLSPGQSAKFKITFPQSGTALFHCAIHAFEGMRGALEVK